MPQNTLAWKTKDQDGRIKIHKEQYPEVIRTYQELKSLQKTADLYGVSKRLILGIVNPEVAARARAYNLKAIHDKRYYSTEKRRAVMRLYRAKKRAHHFTDSKYPDYRCPPQGYLSRNQAMALYHVQYVALDKAVSQGHITPRHFPTVAATPFYSIDELNHWNENARSPRYRIPRPDLNSH